MGLLFIPQMIYEYGEPQWNDTDNGNPENSEKILKTTLPAINRTWIDPGLHGDRTTNCLNHGMAKRMHCIN
jgi:hypothetical protein